MINTQARGDVPNSPADRKNSAAGRRDHIVPKPLISRRFSTSREDFSAAEWRFLPAGRGNFASHDERTNGAYAPLKIPGGEMAQPSYVHGASCTPLIGETIGVHFDKVAERCGERDALIALECNVDFVQGAYFAGPSVEPGPG